jgi:hypothetical protein
MGQTIENLSQWCFAWFEVTGAQGRDRAALWLKARWTTNSTITISFLDGDPELYARVETAARQWIAPGRAHLFFDFRKDTRQTDIRISFTRPGSWSVIGNTCLRIEPEKPTMNLGSLTRNSPDSELERVVLHEFGHALGLVHEHQHPGGGIQWNKEAVYVDLSPGWSHEKIDLNVFDTIKPEEAAMTALDKDSIMMYPIKKSWTLNGFSSEMNQKLSPTDIIFIGNIYQ